MWALDSLKHLCWLIIFKHHISKIIGHRTARFECKLWKLVPDDEERDWHKHTPIVAARKFSQYYWD